MACSQRFWKRAESLEGRPRHVHHSPQRTLQLVGQVHRVGSGNDSEERYGIGRSRKVEQTARQVQQKKDGGFMFRVQRECMYPAAVKDVRFVKVANVELEEMWKK